MSIHSKDSMADTDQEEQQNINGPVITLLQSSTIPEAYLSGTYDAPSTSMNISSDTVT
jgi:hypothetical protein